MTEKVQMNQTTEIEQEKKQKKDRKGSRRLILFLILLIIGLCGGMVYYLYASNLASQKGRLARDEAALGGLLPGKSQEEISELLNQKVEEGMVDIGIQAEPVFEENGKKGRLGIENIQANRYCFQVDLVLDSTGEMIYSSGLIDPGFYVEYVELNQTLQAGDYPATAIFTTYSLDESEDEISRARVNLVLHIMDGTYYR